MTAASRSRTLPEGIDQPHRLHGEVPIDHAATRPEAWPAVLDMLADEGARLVALWGHRSETGSALVSTAWARAGGLLWLDLGLPSGTDGYADVSRHFPVANRMQRALADLHGIHPAGAHDTRPWLDHGDLAAPDSSTPDYPFVRVQGEGVHEIAVGPVHAGIIEPGHFRFSVSGEKVLRLEERLGYVHKGIDARYTRLDFASAARLAGRVSGDSTVAHALAWCSALESALGHTPPVRAAWLRALLLERERVANHLGDLGAIGNDAGLAFGLAQFSRLRENWLREADGFCGHRLMMDQVLPGGVAVDLSADQAWEMARQSRTLSDEVLRLRAIYDEHAGLQDRLTGTGIVSAELARRLGLTGVIGRASGLPHDLRCDHPARPWASLQVRRCTDTRGDVAARVAVRFDELIESLRLIERIVGQLPPGEVRSGLPTPEGRHVGAGWIEGWRGEIFTALEIEVTGSTQRIVRCHSHDPSWQAWPALEEAIIGNIVPDFPLINKSFNLSYAGHDL
jgi:Ni,Fe-hydrogenase III large subunit